jgi:CheY-like chemotaxis protein
VGVGDRCGSRDGRRPCGPRHELLLRDTRLPLDYALTYGPIGPIDATTYASITGRMQNAGGTIPSDAIARLGCRKFAAVVTDVWMPGADGIQVVQAIRKVDSEVPVLVITGGGPGLSIASAAPLAQVWGARKVYVKPFDVRELVADLKAELDG